MSIRETGNKKRRWRVMAIVTISLVLSQAVVFAKTATDEPRHYFSEKKYYNKIEKGKGFALSEKEKIKEGDMHFGWSVGEFYVSGYTQRVEKNGGPVFLKNPGDDVVLGFDLKQDISKLNNDKKLSIAATEDGYDSNFDVPKKNFGKGALFVKYVNHKNEPKVVKHFNYLSKVSKKKEGSYVKLNEEGDYEVALDYTVQEYKTVFGRKVYSSTSDYTIKTIRFSVRNGSAMGFLVDPKTGNELKNQEFAENGFRIDLAGAQYLKVYVKRDVFNGEKSEDTRENRPAKDGEEFTKEGIYTITEENSSTGEKTIKKLYVGTDERYKAQAVTGLSIEEIDAKMAEGASISENGNLIAASNSAQGIYGKKKVEKKEVDFGIPILIGVVAIIGVVVSITRKKKGRGLDK